MKTSALVVAGTLLLARVSYADLVFRGFDNGAGAAGARPSTEAAKAAFLAAVSSSTYTQTFDTLAPGTVPGAGISLGFGASGISADLTPVAFSEITSTQSFEAFPFSSPYYLRSHPTSSNADFFRLQFSQPISAVGFYASDVSDYAGLGGVIPPVEVVIDGIAIPLTSANPTTINTGSAFFFGIVAVTPFSEVILHNPAGATEDSIGIDDIVIVPEPASAVLIGLAGALLMKRRRTAQPLQA